MAHPQQQQQQEQPGKSVPQLNHQEQLHYPGDQERRPPLVQSDVGALIQDRLPRGGAGDKRYQHPDAQSDPTNEDSAPAEPTGAGEEWPIGNRKDIR